MALIRFIASQLNIVDEKEDTVSLPELKQTVGEAECGTYPCVAVDEMTRTYDVLKQLDALDKVHLRVWRFFFFLFARLVCAQISQ